MWISALATRLTCMQVTCTAFHTRVSSYRHSHFEAFEGIFENLQEKSQNPLRKWQEAALIRLKLLDVFLPLIEGAREAAEGDAQAQAGGAGTGWLSAGRPPTPEPHASSPPGEPAQGTPHLSLWLISEIRRSFFSAHKSKICNSMLNLPLSRRRFFPANW